jgi:hypothetical protein
MYSGILRRDNNKERKWKTEVNKKNNKIILERIKYNKNSLKCMRNNYLCT